MATTAVLSIAAGSSLLTEEAAKSLETLEKGPTTRSSLEHPRQERLFCMNLAQPCSLGQVRPTTRSRLQCFKAASYGAFFHVQPGQGKSNWESQRTGFAQAVIVVAVATVTAEVDHNNFARAVHQL